MRSRIHNERVFFVVFLVLGFASLLRAIPAEAHHTIEHGPALLREIGIDQRLGREVPLDLAFRDATGTPVRLRNYLDEKPVVLALVYYECPGLCSLLLNGMVRSFRALPFDIGDEFLVVTVSIDPTEPPELAAAKKQAYTLRYGRTGAGAGWHFLTGEEAAIRRLTEAVGFRYAYDPDSDRYAHPAAIAVLTPGGRVARYLFGLEFPPRDLRLALVEASAGRIGSAVDQVLLYCYQYDPATGKYSLVIMNVLRLAGLATVMLLGTFIVLMCRRDRRRAASAGP